MNPAIFLIPIVILAAAVWYLFSQLGSKNAAMKTLADEMEANRQRLHQLEKETSRLREDNSRKAGEIDQLRVEAKQKKKGGREVQDLESRIKSLEKEHEEEIQRLRDKNAELAQANLSLREEARRAAETAVTRPQRRRDEFRERRDNEHRESGETPARDNPGTAAPPPAPGEKESAPRANPDLERQLERVLRDKNDLERKLKEASGRVHELDKENKRMHGRMSTANRLYVLEKGAKELAQERLFQLQQRYDELERLVKGDDALSSRAMRIREDLKRQEKNWKRRSEAHDRAGEAVKETGAPASQASDTLASPPAGESQPGKTPASSAAVAPEEGKPAAPGDRPPEPSAAAAPEAAAQAPSGGAREEPSGESAGTSKPETATA
ncbi:MAG: hypothetical protein GMKNLPBB_00741 [Myxococcota bacterium]|nr:hypothetical protein [Myxococcota bacterium]